VKPVPVRKDWMVACALACLGGVAVGAVHADTGSPAQTVLPAPTHAYDSAPGQLPPPQEERDPVPPRPVVRASATGQPAQPVTRATVTRSELSERDGDDGPGRHGKDDHGGNGRDGRGDRDGRSGRG
jgi:hypothetical protein